MLLRWRQGAVSGDDVAEDDVRAAAGKGLLAAAESAATEAGMAKSVAVQAADEAKRAAQAVDEQHFASANTGWADVVSNRRVNRTAAAAAAAGVGPA